MTEPLRLSGRMVSIPTDTKRAIGWVIDKDLLYASDTSFTDRTGHRSYAFREGEDMVTFRLFDDDGELYYEGRIAQHWLDGEEALAFAPLDWARADAGCTRMDFFLHDKWETL